MGLGPARCVRYGIVGRTVYVAPCERQLSVNVTEAGLMEALRSEQVDAWSFLVPFFCTVVVFSGVFWQAVVRCREGFAIFEVAVAR